MVSIVSDLEEYVIDEIVAANRHRRLASRKTRRSVLLRLLQYDIGLGCLEATGVIATVRLGERERLSRRVVRAAT